MYVTRISRYVYRSVLFAVSHNQWRTQEFFRGGGVPTNSVEDRGQRERGSGGGRPESGVPLNLLSFVKTSEFRGGGGNPLGTPLHITAVGIGTYYPWKRGHYCTVFT
jgi:hypothetical protein